MKLHLFIAGTIVAFIAGGLLLNKGNLLNVLPFIFILACPIMMIVMMRDRHKH